MDCFGERPFHAWAPLPDGVTLVTDAAATPDRIGSFENVGVEVVMV